MRRWILTVIGVSLVLAACGDESEPTAVAAPTRWDPCSIPADAIGATGLNPDYRDEGWGKGIVVEDWARCVYKPVGSDFAYALSVKSSSTQTIARTRENPANSHGTVLRIGDHDAFQYEGIEYESAETCNIAVDLRPGVAVFSVNYLIRTNGIEPCEVAVKHVTDLEAFLPTIHE